MVLGLSRARGRVSRPRIRANDLLEPPKRGKNPTQAPWQQTRGCPSRDTHRLAHVAQRVLGDDATSGATQEQSDGGPVMRLTQSVVHGRKVEAQLPGMFCLELTHLELDDDEGPQPQMVEEQVDVEAPAIDLEVHLASDEGESDTEFEEEIADSEKQAAMKLSLPDRGAQFQELQDVRVLQESLCAFGDRTRQGTCEVRDGAPLTLEQPGIDLVFEDVPGPSVLEGSLQVPRSCGRIRDTVEESTVVPPGQFGNGPLHNCRIWPSPSQIPHVPKVPGGKPPEVRKLSPQISCQSGDDPGSPALISLALKQLPADPPVQEDEVAVDGQQGVATGLSNTPLQVPEEVVVVPPGRRKALLDCSRS